MLSLWSYCVLVPIKFKLYCLNILSNFLENRNLQLCLKKICWSSTKRIWNFLAKRFIIKTFSIIAHQMPDKLHNLWTLKKHLQNEQHLHFAYLIWKSKNFRHQIHRAYFHPLFKFSYDDHTFTPSTDTNIKNYSKAQMPMGYF